MVLPPSFLVMLLLILFLTVITRLLFSVVGRNALPAKLNSTWERTTPNLAESFSTDFYWDFVRIVFGGFVGFVACGFVVFSVSVGIKAWVESILVSSLLLLLLLPVDDPSQVHCLFFNCSVWNSLKKRVWIPKHIQEGGYREKEISPLSSS